MESVYEEMLGWPLAEQAKYIRGFADGEGGPRFYRYKGEKMGHHRKGYPHVRAIVISNTDKHLLNTVQRMLENLGISSHIYLDAKEGVRKATMDAWALKILDRDSLIKYRDLVSFSMPKKRDTLHQIIASYRKLGS